MDGDFIIDSIYYGYGEKQLTPALKQQAHSVGASMTILDIFSLEAQVTGEKLSESISGWYTYYKEDSGTGILNRLHWSFEAFFGLRFGPLMSGVTLGFGGRQGISRGFVLGSPIPQRSDKPSNIGKLRVKYGKNSGWDLAGSFRQYHRNDGY